MEQTRTTQAVKIYTTSSCVWCRRAKQFMAEKGIPYTEMNVEENEAALQEMVRKTGQYGVPVLEVNRKIIVGFDPDGIEEAWEQK